MKLEVGQKIGIYEVVGANYAKGDAPDFGTQHLGIKEKTHISLYDSKSNISYMYYRNEVSKVGSLIVKRIK